jgi:hypothetical protein
VDNTRLVFAGMPSTEMRAAVLAKEVTPVARVKKLYVWDITTKTATLYADVQYACFSKGNIRYTTHVDEAAGKRTVREGPFGSERETEETIPVLTDAERRERVDGLACKLFRPSQLVPPAVPNREVMVLQDGEGYLDLGPGRGINYLDERSRQSTNLTLYAAPTGRAIQLPLTWDQGFAPAEITYSSFRGAYVLHPRPPRGQSLNRDPLMAYLLWVDGRVEPTSIPYAPAESLIDPYPTKMGWVFGGGNFYNSSGLYLFNNQSVSKIDTGLVQRIAVSPDGCSAAVAIQNKHLEGGAPFNLKVYHLCNGEH